jgi:tetratricopeptide (TPR) repeat protein
VPRGGGTAGEIEALRGALRASPGWGTAVRSLAEALERRGDVGGARSLLEQAVALRPLEAQNHGMLGELLWRVGETGEAVRRVEHAVRLLPGYAWAWEILAEWCERLGRPERVEALARELADKQPDDAEAWYHVARTLSGAPDRPERIAAFDRMIALEPRNPRGYDLKATALTRARRFDEALETLRSPIWGDATPVELRGREAWVASERGDTPGAVRRMAALVKEHPTYAWGWKQLFYWYRELQEHDDCLEAAENLARLNPQDPESLALLGEYHLKEGREKMGLELLRRVAAVAPHYTPAGLRLFDHELSLGRLAEAARLLEALKAYRLDEYVLAREVQLECKRRNADAALAAFRRLAGLDFEDRWPIQEAADAFGKAGNEMAGRLDAALEELVGVEGVNPQVGGVWVKRGVEEGRLDAREARLAGLRKEGRAGWKATATYLETLAEKNLGVRFRKYARTFEGELRSRPETWGAVGYGWVTLSDHRAAAEWMGDWEKREGVQGWMLQNLAAALRTLGRDDEAARVSRHSLERARDASWPCHAVWLGLDAALAGDVAEMARHLDPVQEGWLADYYKFLFRLAGAAAEAGPGEAFLRARERLRTAEAGFSGFRGFPELKRFRRRAVRRIGRAGGVAGLIWAFWQGW